MPNSEADLLPTEHDFDPFSGDLDAQHAWRSFGGLTLDQAHRRFRENPLCYQEDFMFMGPVAFAFYFPVIDEYLRSDLEADPHDDHQGWILAHCIKAQREKDAGAHVGSLIPRIRSLIAYMSDNIQRFGADSAEQQRVADAWRMLKAHLDGADRAGRQGEPSDAADSP